MKRKFLKQRVAGDPKDIWKKKGALTPSEGKITQSDNSNFMAITSDVKMFTVEGVENLFFCSLGIRAEI